MRGSRLRRGPANHIFTEGNALHGHQFLIFRVKKVNLWTFPIRSRFCDPTGILKKRCLVSSSSYKRNQGSYSTALQREHQSDEEALISLTWKLYSRVIGGTFPGDNTGLPEWRRIAWVAQGCWSGTVLPEWNSVAGVATVLHKFPTSLTLSFFSGFWKPRQVLQCPSRE